ncbi:MAG: hypothetical protein KF855_16870 [Acidobacteria bacterium]|nr:hypothetical protein [Acidobacteriota bacterium]
MCFKNILGLDLGVTSIGWALIRFGCDENGKILRDEDGLILNAEIIAIGVRIFPSNYRKNCRNSHHNKSPGFREG